MDSDANTDPCKLRPVVRCDGRDATGQSTDGRDGGPPGPYGLYGIQPMVHLSLLKRSLLVLIGLCCCGLPCRAQIGAERIQRPIDTPTVSPYLNLLRNDGRGGPVLNYYGLVRPQVQAFGQAQQFGQELQRLESRQLRSAQAGQLLPGAIRRGTTGHPVVFQSFTPPGAAGGIGGASGFAGGVGGFAGGFSAGGAAVGGFAGSGSAAGFAPGFSTTSAGPAGGAPAGGGSFGGAGFVPGGSIGGSSFGGVTGHGAMFGTWGAGGRGGF